MTGASDLLFHAIPGLPAGAGNYTGDAGSHSSGAHRLDTVTYADGSTDVLMVPVDPALPRFWRGIRCPIPPGPSGAHLRDGFEGVTNANQFSFRIDHKISDKISFSRGSTWTT